MERITICGRVCREAEIRAINDKQFYCIDLAVNIGKDKTRFWGVNYPKYGETDLRQWFKKGAVLSAEGRLSLNIYRTREGESKIDQTVWADFVGIEAFAPKEEDGDAARAEKPKPKPEPAAEEDNPEDDLPF